MLEFRSNRTTLVKNTKGKFITFEGIEGSGKTTQTVLLQEYLKGKGIPFLPTREPGGTEFGRQIRRILLDERGPERTPVAELLLYLADRYQDLRQVIEPALDQGTHVLCDRYHDATVTYQGYARGIDLSLIDAFTRILGIREPDLTILFDLDVEAGLQRAHARNLQCHAAVNEGRFEAEALEFHRRVRQGYLDLAQKNPARIKIVSALESPYEIHGRVVEYVEALLNA